MQPTNRFRQSREAIGGRLLAGATGMKITLWRDCEGDLFGDVEVSSSVGGDEQGDALELARELLADFAENRE